MRLKPDHPCLMGAAGRYFPEDWKHFVEIDAAEKHRRDMVKAYNDFTRSRDKIHIDGREIGSGPGGGPAVVPVKSATVRLDPE